MKRSKLFDEGVDHGTKNGRHLERADIIAMSFRPDCAKMTVPEFMGKVLKGEHIGEAARNIAARAGQKVGHA